jgi:predicted neuraminidase
LLCFAQQPFLQSQILFPTEHWHNHASCIVELPNGDFFATWYHGSGERTADDVIIEGARLPRGQSNWSPRFTLADTPNFPDANPALFVDSRQRLWLLWPVILANEWHTALMKYRISSDYLKPGPPRWDVNETMLFIPRNFEAKVKAVVEPQLQAAAGTPRADRMKRLLEHAADKYFARMGWMTRVHPTELPSGRILVPLYSDGFSFSLMAITDDGGRTWSTSEPLVGAGNIQPSVVRRRDGTLVAYMRDNGPPPKRIQVSESKDDGVTWSPVVDSDFPNPGSGIEAIALKNGSWALIYNDTESRRASLAVSLSDDEGRTWKWKRHLELDPKGVGAFHYPSILQAKDGSLHAMYSYYPGPRQQTIKHAHFNEAWIKAGE